MTFVTALLLFAGTPDDITAAILFLASEEARFINGTTLVADGGRLNIL